MCPFIRDFTSCQVKTNLQFSILKLLLQTPQNYIIDHLTDQSVNGRSSVCVSHTGTYTNPYLTLCIQMDSSFWFDTIFLGVGLYFFLNVFFVRLSFYLNSVDPDEMLHCAEFHPGLHCKSNSLGVSFIQRVYSPLA